MDTHLTHKQITGVADQQQKHVVDVTGKAWGLQALNDFKERIKKYEEVYETITDRNLHYIKLIDMYCPISWRVLHMCRGNFQQLIPVHCGN